MLSRLLAFFRQIFSPQSPANGSSTPQSPASPPAPSPNSSSNENLPPTKPASPPSKPQPSPVRLVMPLALFQEAAGLTQARAAKWYDVVCDACERYAINNPWRLAGFIAQVGHESGGFVYTKELWGPTPAQKRYGERADLGNTSIDAIRAAAAAGVPDVGLFYRGHGLIQITGYYNHLTCGEALGIDCVNNPEQLAIDKYAALSAAWYWYTHGLNILADKGDNLAMSRAINLGSATSTRTPNGMADRDERYSRAKKAFNLL